MKRTVEEMDKKANAWERRLFIKGTMGAVASLAALPSLSQGAPPQAAQLRPQGRQGSGESPTVLYGWGPFTPSSHAGGYFKIVYPPSTAQGELQIGVTFTLWIPDGLRTVRSVIVHQHGAGIAAAQAGGLLAYDLYWQALAKKCDCALLGPSYHVINNAVDLAPGGAEWWFDPRKGSDKVFVKALGDLASKSDHSELATVPWCFWGHSGGGIWADVMTTLHPGRVVANFLRSGTAAMFRPQPEFPQPTVPDPVYKVPAMMNFGVGEKGKAPWDGSVAMFQEYRAKGAPVGLAPDPRTAHFCGDSRYLAAPFFEACLAMRLPEKGQELRPVDMRSAWLATPLSDVAVPAAEYKGEAAKAVWLPNEAVAKTWMEYVRTGSVGDSSAPPAPFDVKLANLEPQGNQATLITWEAESGLTGGIGSFVVLRDGYGIARLPEGPPLAVFGSPLFQGLSFHDTPFAPLPQMSYLDTSADHGAKHEYTVVTISRTGVPSKASEPGIFG